MAHLRDYEIDRVKNAWSENDISTDNAVLTVAHTAQAFRHHIVMKCDASFSDPTATGLLTIKFGSLTKGRKYIHGAGALDFSEFGFENPTVNDSVSAVLAAGGSGVFGTLTLTGYSTGHSEEE